MKKFMNYRPFVIIAVAMIFATIFATFVFVTTSSKLICFMVLAGLFVIFLILQYFLNRRAIMLLLAVIFFMAIPFGSLYIKSAKADNFSEYNGEIFTISGKIAENYKFTTSGNLAFILSDVKVVEGDLDKINNSVTIYTNPNNLVLENFRVGRIIRVKASLTFFNLSEDISKSVSYLSRGNSCYGYANFYDIEFTDEYDISVRDEFCENIYETLKNSDVKHADIAYAMLFGESNYLDDDVKSEFRDTGIAHIVAVSGLHFSVIFGLIVFVINRFKLPVNQFFGIKILIIFLYCYLCKFSVSVVRTGLLAFFSIYATIRGKAYDNMSCLAIIAIIFLVANPLSLFSLSFILSFSAVVSIALLTAPLERLFSKLFKEKFASLLATNFSVQIGLFAINMLYFGKFSCLGIIANLILVPIVSFAFVLLFIGVLFMNSFPLSILLAKAYGLLMDVVVKFNRYISSINFSFRLGSIHYLAILFSFVLMFILSDYLFVDKKKRAIAGSVSLILLICTMLLWSKS